MSKIKKLPKDVLIELARKIKPVMPFKNKKRVCITNPDGHSGSLWWLKNCDIRKESFICDAKQEIPAENLIPLCVIPTWHDCGFIGIFKPSIEEVLVQIPAELREQVVAFETEMVETDVNNWVKDVHVDYKNYQHIARTVLYAGEMPFQLQSRPVILNRRKYPGLQKSEPRKVCTYTGKPMSARMISTRVNTLLKDFEANFVKEKE